MRLPSVGRRREIVLSGVLVVALLLAAAGLVLFPDVAEAGLCEPRCSGNVYVCYEGDTYFCTECYHPTYCLKYLSCYFHHSGC